MIDLVFPSLVPKNSVVNVSEIKMPPTHILIEKHKLKGKVIYKKIKKK